MSITKERLFGDVGSNATYCFVGQSWKREKVHRNRSLGVASTLLKGRSKLVNRFYELIHED